MKKYSGFLVSFEGGDGSGKSTHVGLFMNFLKSKYPNISCYTTREPGGTPYSEAVRALSKDSRFKDKSTLSELMLFESARADIVEKCILPRLENGEIVVMDRFFDSTTAYQSYGRGLAKVVVDRANKIATQGLVPDLTFYMRVDPRVAFERKGGQDNDPFELEGLKFQERVVAGFDEIAKENPDRFVVIDTSKDLQEVFTQITDTFSTRFNKKP